MVAKQFFWQQKQNNDINKNASANPYFLYRENHPNNPSFPYSLICGGDFFSANFGTCGGDSGAPLILDEKGDFHLMPK